MDLCVVDWGIIVTVVQTIIAVGALFYAWRAYQKILEQIRISNDQTKIALDSEEALIRERKHNLRLDLINNTLNQFERLCDLIYNLEVICAQQDYVLRRATLNKLNPERISSVEDLTRKYKKDLEGYKKYQDTMGVFLKKIVQNDDIGLDDIKNNIKDNYVMLISLEKTLADYKFLVKNAEMITQSF